MLIMWKTGFNRKISGFLAVDRIWITCGQLLIYPQAVLLR
jgi:hypothetical protein